ncbi:magnesium transporter CorA family protein [Shewanella sp. Isolate11]|uniref:magnesium transporter CorA family protein n=1 Tax=Shewanella sp. Isolate11 TaxID=2908530 RepID=UPI001EFE4F8B|nr:magnesium transporter CorA family protein [Shewanella sp. Isolate11]MCG9697632.1 magnesium transporter CorA family protein [Shewanella sp. Isolate11]
MLTTLLYNPKDQSLSKGAEANIASWKQSDDAVLWLNIEGELTPTLQTMLQQTFGLHHLALQDASRDRHPPKIEDFDDHTFMVLRGLSADSDSINCDNILLALFVSERFIITRHLERSLSIERAMNAVEKGEISFANGTGGIALKISRFVVKRYHKILFDLEARLEELEAVMLTTADDKILSEVVLYKTDLTRLRRNFHYHVELFDTLRNEPSVPFDSSLAHEIYDVCEHQHRAASLADLFYQVSSDLIDGYISISAHRLNNIMKVLTIITAIFVPLTFIAGIYGMNFEYIPELKHKDGYFIVWGVMLSITAVLIWLFRKRKWL